MGNLPPGLYFTWLSIIYSSRNREFFILNWDQSKTVTEQQSVGCLTGKMLMGISVFFRFWPPESQFSYPYQSLLEAGPLLERIYQLC